MLDEFSESVGEFFNTNIEQHTAKDHVLNVSSDLFHRVLLFSPEILALISRELKRAGILHAELPLVIDGFQTPEEKRLSVAIGDQRYSVTLTVSQLTIQRNTFGELSALVTTEPLSLLSQWGAKIGAQRPIDALYRVRQASKDESVLPKQRTITVIGYPIFLTSSPSPFTEKYCAGAI